MIRAVIFDVDGVLADTEPIHLACFQRILAEEGIHLSWEQYYEKYLAYDDRRAFEEILADRGHRADADRVKDLIQRKAALYEEEAKKGLNYYKDAVEFIRKAAQKYPLAVASGALRAEVEMILKGAGLRDLFRAVIGADDCERSKPHPEPYWKALDRLNAAIVPTAAVLAFEALAVEDSVNGILSAKNAGMKTLAVANTYPPDKLLAGGADWVVSHLSEVRLEDLETRFAIV